MKLMEEAVEAHLSEQERCGNAVLRMLLIATDAEHHNSKGAVAISAILEPLVASNPAGMAIGCQEIFCQLALFMISQGAPLEVVLEQLKTTAKEAKDFPALVAAHRS